MRINIRNKGLVFLRYFFRVLLVVVLAVVLRMFLLEVFYIPSDSMNSSLYPGDVIVVNKVNYGALLPTSLMEIPFFPVLILVKPLERWLLKKRWQYRRLPGLDLPKRGDVVVFKLRNAGNQLIKRCIGLPGDTLCIRYDTVYVNGNTIALPDSARLYYRMQTRTGIYTEEHLKYLLQRNDYLIETSPVNCLLSLTRCEAARLLRIREVKSMVPARDTSFDRSHRLFPHGIETHWNCSMYGPVVVPKKGVTVKLDMEHLPLYENVIRSDERNDLTVKDGCIYINRLKTDRYKFKLNYYFMLGDNRLNSTDSRFLGFIAEDQILGRASLILFSIGNDHWLKDGFQWWRCLKKIN